MSLGCGFRDSSWVGGCRWRVPVIPLCLVGALARLFKWWWRQVAAVPLFRQQVLALTGRWRAVVGVMAILRQVCNLDGKTFQSCIFNSAIGSLRNQYQRCWSQQVLALPKQVTGDGNV